MDEKPMCEYCSEEDQSTYAYHGDEICAGCLILVFGVDPEIIKNAPLEKPANPSYEDVWLYRSI